MVVIVDDRCVSLKTIVIMLTKIIILLVMIMIIIVIMEIIQLLVKKKKNNDDDIGNSDYRSNHWDDLISILLRMLSTHTMVYNEWMQIKWKHILQQKYINDWGSVPAWLLIMV